MRPCEDAVDRDDNHTQISVRLGAPGGQSFIRNIRSISLKEALFSLHFTEWEGSQGGVQSPLLRDTQLITAEPAVHSPPDLCPLPDAFQWREGSSQQMGAVVPERPERQRAESVIPLPNPGHSGAQGSCQHGVGGGEWQSSRPPEDLGVQEGY